MPRVKRGPVARRRRKRVLKLAKGYYGGKSRLYRTAKQQVMKSLFYAYRDRRQRKRDFRRLWIARINAPRAPMGSPQPFYQRAEESGRGNQPEDACRDGRS